MDLENVLQIVIYSVPLYSSITCALLLMLTYRDSVSISERRIKILLILYCIFTFFLWLGTITFHINHSLFIYLNPFFYFCLLLACVISYHFIFYLTATRKDDRFSKWYYLPPVVIFLVVLIWTHFIPSDIQYAIAYGNDAVTDEYIYFSIFYTSKHALRIICLAVFTFLCARRLYFYSKVVISRYGPEYKKYIFWLWYSIGFGLVLLFASIVTVLSGYTHIHEFLSNIFIVLIISTSHGVLVYNIIRRNYYLIFTEKKALVKLESEEQSLIQATDTGSTVSKKMLSPRRQYVRYQKNLMKNGRAVGENLTKKQFDLYFKDYKPYLNPDFRITDLIEVFEVNRTYISRFVNQEYGMNFNRYVNRCRLQKLEILTGHVSNSGKNMQELVKLAGFGSYRNYTRAKLIEEEEISKKRRKK